MLRKFEVLSRVMFRKAAEKFSKQFARIDWLLLWVKFRQGLRIWLRAVARRAFPPVISGDEALQWIAFPIFLWFILVWRGFSEMSAEFDIWWAGKQAIIWALPFWILGNAVYVLLRFKKIRGLTGEWIGRQFVYNEPVLAFSKLAMTAENNKLFKFRFKDAVPGCLISYKFELDGSHSRISLIVKGHPTQLPEFTRHDERRYGKGKILPNRNRELFFRYYLAENSDPFQVRIYVTGWELQNAAEDDQRTL